jgi:hypothetical protein
MKLSDKLHFWRLCSWWVLKMLTEEHIMKRHSHRGWDMGVACNPWIKAAVHGVDAHIIADKEKIQTDQFNLQDHVQCSGTENVFCLWNTCLKVQQSIQASMETHLRNCVMRSRTSDVACFMTTPTHMLPPQHKISSRHLAGNNSIIPRTAQTYYYYYWWGGTESLGICSSP